MDSNNKIKFYRDNPFSFIPLINNTKIAKDKGWQKYAHELSQYKPEELAGSNVGIVTGPASNLLVLDIDNPRLFESFGRRYHYSISEGFTVKTGKGSHRYYRYPNNGKEYRCKAYPIFGFDIRGVGGYVVAPYSIHPETGCTYDITNDSEIPIAPELLLKYCSAIDHSSVPKLDKIKSPEVIALIENGADKGHRSEAIMRVIDSLVANGLDDDQIFYIFNTYKIGEKYLEKQAHLRDQWLQEQIDKAEYYFDNIQSTPDTKQKKKVNISYVNGRQMMEKDISAIWLIKDLLEKGGHTIITGKSGMGKSIVTLNIALRLASASKDGFLGHCIPRPLKVLIIQCENSEAFMKERLQKIVQANPEYSDVADSIEFVYFNGRHDYPNIKLASDDIDEIIDQINTDKKPDVVILDPYKSYSGVEENSNDKNREVLDRFFYILDSFGITSIIVHHEGKSSELTGTARSRGASTITDAINNHWSISRVKDQNTSEENIVIMCEKARNYKKFDDVYFQIIDGYYLKQNIEPFDPRILAEILSENNGCIDKQTEFIKQIILKMKVNYSKARKLIDTAVKNKYILAEKYGKNMIRYLLPSTTKVA